MLSQCPRLRNENVNVLAAFDKSYSKQGGIPRNWQRLAAKNNAIYGRCHTKLAILIYENGVRVVITTANFWEKDWGGMTQGVWYQDFPLASGPCEDGQSQFRQALVHYVRSLATKYIDNEEETGISTEESKKAATACSSFAAELERFDYSAASVALVSTIPESWSLARNLSNVVGAGHMGLRHVLKQEPLPALMKGKETSDRWKILAQYSSQGSMKNRKYEADLSETLSTSSSTRPNAWKGKLQLQVLWPTVENIRTSVLGWDSGTSCPGHSRDVYETDSDGKELGPRFRGRLYKWVGEPSLGRGHATAHMKSYLSYLLSADMQRVEAVAYMCLTSGRDHALLL
ncbi:unnamed protein product [Chrysoparadoxa australica]